MKKWTTIALAVFLCLTPMTAFAADAPAGETQQDQEITAGSVYDFLVEQAMQSDGIQSDALYDVGVNMDSFQMLNLQYEVLQTTLESKGFGKDGSLEIPDFQTGYAANVQALFEQTFSGLREQVDFDAADLPKSFSVSGMLSDAQAARSAFSEGFKSSRLYRIVRSQLSIGSVFEQAKKGASMPSLSTDYTDRLGELTAGFETQLDTSKAMESFTAAKEKGQNAFSSASGNLDQAAAEQWNQAVADNSTALKSGSSFVQAATDYLNATVVSRNFKENLGKFLNTPLIGIFLYGEDLAESAQKMDEAQNAPTFEDLFSGDY